MHDVETEAVVAPQEQSSGEHASQASTDRGSERCNEQTFSLRAVLAGGFVGTLICFSSLYYGLQSGQTNSMPLPSVLLGYAVFKPLTRYLRRPFNPNENVLVMTVAASMGGIPYTAGLSGTIPALEFLITGNDNGPFIFTLWRLILWCLGACLFGIVFAVPFRKHFVQRSDLRFPTGTAMAAVISMLHKKPNIMNSIRDQQKIDATASRRSAGRKPYSTVPSRDPARELTSGNREMNVEEVGSTGTDEQPETSTLRSGLISFIVSGIIAILTYAVPVLQTLYVFGKTLAQKWAWSIDMSPAYVGFGMIMHPLTTAHMFLGCVIGWAILSPLAKSRGWAPGPVEDWSDGSQGWNIWVALGVVLGDSLVGIVWIMFGLLKESGSDKNFAGRFRSMVSAWSPKSNSARTALSGTDDRAHSEPDEQTSLLSSEPDPVQPHTDGSSDEAGDPLSNLSAVSWFVGITLFCILVTWYLFGDLLRIWEISLSIILIFPLGIASIRSMGETDNALAASLGKIPQFLFAALIPKSNPNAIIISLLIGGIAEGGTYQSSDVMEHLKTGHLVGANPKSLFYGQVIGSIFGATLCSCIYKLFTTTYAVPSEIFTVPHAQLWLASAHLAYGRGLPPGVLGFAVAGFVVSAMCAIIRIAAEGKKRCEQIPSGIAVGIGIYILPMYTIPQTLGGLAHYLSKKFLHTGELSVITIAVGLVLGQSLVNIVTLALISAGVSPS